MRLFILLLLSLLFCFSFADAVAPVRGYMTNGSHVLVCNCRETPPLSECGDPIANACDSKESCIDLCKQSTCKEATCIVSSMGGADMYCNTKDESLTYLREKAKEHGKQTKYWKASLSNCGF